MELKSSPLEPKKSWYSCKHCKYRALSGKTKKSYCYAHDQNVELHDMCSDFKYQYDYD